MHFMFDSCLHVQAQASSLFLVWSFAHFLLSKRYGDLQAWQNDSGHASQRSACGCTLREIQLALHCSSFAHLPLAVVVKQLDAAWQHPTTGTWP